MPEGPSLRHVLFISAALSACGQGTRDDAPATSTPVASTSSAAAPVEAIRARFGRDALRAGSVIGWEEVAGRRMHPITPAIDRGVLARPVRLELPPSADGELLLEDLSSRLSIRFTRIAREAVASKLVIADGGFALYGDVVHRIDEEGTEDFVRFDARPPIEALSYRVDVRRVAGLRLVGNSLEFLDVGGTPRLRVAPPYVIDATGERHEAFLSVTGCAVDSDPRAPWDRPVVAPGAEHCEVHVRWHDVAYPLLVDPTWSSTGSMAKGRWNHGAALLPSGKVLVAGGEGPGAFVSSAELFDGVGTWAATSDLPQTRCRFTTTKLPSGKILIVGGECGGVKKSALLYDESTGTFTATGSMSVARQQHTATLLPSGKVLVAGGCTTNGYTTAATPTNTAEMWDGATFTTVGNMKNTHCAHVAALMPTGKVLVAGGGNSFADLFDGTSAFTALPGLSKVRAWAQAVTLSSGKVLVVGGRENLSGTNDSIKTTDLFDGTSFTAGPVMGTARTRFAMIPLATGRFLTVGGNASGGADIAAAEYFDGTSFSPIGSMVLGRSEFSATLLPSGRVLVAGKSATDSSATKAELLGQQGLAGDICSAAGDCESGACRGGFCCSATTCTGTCLKCAATTGACVPLTSADDPLTCTGNNTCDAAGACKLKNGQSATVATSCASGLLADGVCCNTACGAACDTCNVAGKVGTCSPTPGYAGAPSCAPFLCQSATTCPTTCTSDAQCTGTAFCDAGVCKARKASGGTCATGAHECANGLCVDGFCCNTTCTSNCMACAAALSGVTGSDGTCTNVVNGGRGRGECGPSTCSSSTNLSTPVCNGSGSCTTKSTSCGSFACTGGACATACTKDADCGTDNYCNGTTCAAKSALGVACSKASACLSGNCVDGVCCSSACTGACEACNESSSKGTCVAVTGTPRGTHPACNGVGTSCAGSCDGANRAVCSYPAAGTTCGAGCSGSSISVCSATGSCLAAASCPGNYACASTTACRTTCAGDTDCASTAYCTTSGCAPKLAAGGTCSRDGECGTGHCVAGVCCATACSAYACLPDGSACRTSCASDVECGPSSHCVSSACVPRQANGTTCATGDECTSGNCVDGVCCDRPCSGNCEACSATKSGVAGSTGTCSFIVDGKDPDAECGTPSCTGSVLNANVCNGSGVCRALVKDCGSAKCVVSGSSGVCENTCTVDGDCGSSGFCKSGLCAPKIDRGGACAANVECTSGFCADGVCCNEACSGQCQACAEPGSVGTCLAVKGTPRPPRTDCNGKGTSCYGQCDGVNLAACGYANAGQSCGKGCTDGKSSVCDTTGVCLEPTACAGNFACDSATNKCKSSCASDAECGGGYTCSANKCVPKAAATCSPDGTQSIPSGDAGPPQTCAPYRCLSTGACADKCTTTADCASGATCDTATQQCVPAAPAEDSGGCAVQPGAVGFAGSVGPVGLLLAIGTLARRRRLTSDDILARRRR